MRPPPSDPVLQAANRLYEEFNEGGMSPGVGTRVQKWGDNQQLDIRANNVVNQEYCFVDVGPFPFPVSLRIDMEAANRASGITTQTAYQYRAVIGLGDAAISLDYEVLPRYFTTQSLQLYVRRRPQVFIENEGVRVAVWATPQATQGLPVPMKVEEYPMAIGVGSAVLEPPPRWATHMMVLAGTISLSMRMRVTYPSKAAQDMLAFGSTAAAGQPQQLLPVFHDATVYTIIRSASASADAYLVAYFR